MEELLLQFSGLLGFAVFIALVVNIAKTFGWVKDGQSQNWVAGLNLLGLAGLLALRVFRPEMDVEVLDAQIGQFTEVAMVLFVYITQLLGSKLTYIAVKNVPVIGKSFSASD